MSTPDPADILAGKAAPLAHPAASPAERALLEWAEAHPIERPKLDMDGTGQRYRAHVPDGDKPRSYTRVTSFASALDDEGGLTIWRHRLLAAGLVSTDEMVAACRKAADHDDERTRKSSLSSVIAAALHQAGEKLKADLGTAIHLAMEHAVAGTGETPPAPYDADVAAALAAMSAAGIEPVVELCESRLWNPDFEVIGTADALAAGSWVGGRLRTVDYKTGSSIERNGHAIQAALYANATHRWTADGWAEVPPIDKATGYIVHAPIGTGTATVHEVDLSLGAVLAELAREVRAARKQSNVAALFTPAKNAGARGDVPPVAPGQGSEAPATASLPEDPTDWIVERVRAVAAASDTAKATLGRRWPDAMPTTPPWTDEQLAALNDVLVPIEADHRIEPPFPPIGSIFAPLPEAPTTTDADDDTPLPPSMWTIDDQPGPVDLELADAITTRFAALDDERKMLAATWARDAKSGSRRWAVARDDLTPRLLAIYGAVLSSLQNLWDGDGAPDCELITRAALSLAIGEDVQPGWRTGAIIGALTIDQARRLDEMAVAFGLDDHTAAEVGAKALALTAA